MFIEQKMEFDIVPYLFTFSEGDPSSPAFIPLDEVPSRVTIDSPFRHAVREGWKDLSDIIDIDTGDMRYYTAPRTSTDIINLARGGRGTRVYEIKMVL